ncbi:MAG TPA: right-handed parallel beta-helix repeat-containing protein [Solirubrobacterales bacterium]
MVTTAEPTSASDCTLESAIDAANTAAPSGNCVPNGPGPGYRIEFALPSLPATITPVGGLPTEPKLRIAADVEVVGPGASQLTISGGSVSRVFEIQSGIVSLSGLTVADGQSKETGAGLLIQNPATVQLTQVTVSHNEVQPDPTMPKLAEGAGIMNHGRLTLTESTVSGNTARTPTLEPGVEANGGGIATARNVATEFLPDTLTLDRSTVSGNLAVAEGSGTTDTRGGGIFVYETSTLTVRGSTISGNEAKVNGAVAGDDASGGGIFIWPSTPQATIESSTIAANSAVTSGANLFAAGPTALRSTIVAGPVGSSSCAGGAVASSGYNLDEGTSCNFNVGGDQSGVDPRLGPLAGNGGPTQTMALLNGSPAIDRGSAAVGETSDQRGLRRPVDIPSVPNVADGADVGAFEVQVPHVDITSGPRDGETIADAQPTFEFAAADASGFACTIDGAATPCSSPFKTSPLANGGHTFTVAAIGESGYAGDAASRSFTVEVKTETKPPVAVKPLKAPQTKLGSLASKTTKRRLTIRFSASEAGSTFQCKLDQRKWQSCRSPYKTPKLALGKHVFKVKAKGKTGLVDSSPATKKFRVVAPSWR